MLPLLLVGCGLGNPTPPLAPGADDAGPPDAGGPDGGQADGGEADAGPTPMADAGSADAGTLRVLFVGNSYTATNDLPAVVAALGPRLEVEAVVMPGARLIDQVSARQRLGDGGFDVVVLQGQSLEPILGTDDFYVGASTLSRAAREGHTRTLWFQTWARRAGDPLYSDPMSGVHDPEEMTRKLHDRYHTAQLLFGGELADVGNIWQRFGPELYASDGSHPSAEGTLVSACVIYTALTGNAGTVREPARLGLPGTRAQELCDLASSSRCLYSGGTLCDFHCVDFGTDPEHCGACATRCAAGLACVDGKCT
ncbi:MAG: hypothetical protein K1X89_25720 [Myxococcaceae bacterium]|nr:hypothetical protein [Myxococcaceae bacterium]